jgi:class 3 adenylate cyclase
MVAVLITDVADYTVKVAVAEDDVVRRVATDLEAFAAIAESERGRIVANRGDGLKIVFADPVAAMRAALAMQDWAIGADGRTADARARVKHRMGLHCGEAVVLGSQVTGRAVAVAARLEQLCPPGKICYSDELHLLVGKKLNFRRDFGGLEEAHNLPMVKAWVAHAPSDLSNEPVVLRRSGGKTFPVQAAVADGYSRGYLQGFLTAIGLLLFVLGLGWLLSHAPGWFLRPDEGSVEVMTK